MYLRRASLCKPLQSLQIFHVPHRAALLHLLANRYVPLGLILLCPVSVNILGFHIFIGRAPTGLSSTGAKKPAAVCMSMPTAKILFKVQKSIS